jgi:hypothetical protein
MTQTWEIRFKTSETGGMLLTEVITATSWMVAQRQLKARYDNVEIKYYKAI